MERAINRIVSALDSEHIQHPRGTEANRNEYELTHFFPKKYIFQ